MMAHTRMSPRLRFPGLAPGQAPGLAALLLAGMVMGHGHALAAPPGDKEAMASEYRAWLDQGRTAARAADFVRTHSPGFTVVDPLASEPRPVEPGDRLIFVDRGRTVLLVVMGEAPLVQGARLIAAHIDTPAPRLSLVNMTKSGQVQVKARFYGRIRPHHWLHLPLAVVGRVAKSGQNSEPPVEIDIALGLDDDFALYATDVDRRDQSLTIMTSSISPESTRTPAPFTLVQVLSQRYGLTAQDMQAAELYAVPRHRAREVGLDRSLIGAHGQDDRANSYVAWRALVDLPATPAHTAMVWLVDREEEGSYHPAGAGSRFLDMVFAYLLRAQGARATEAVLGRSFERTQALSADTPPALDPNWPEVHDPRHAPILGQGPALFPYTGHGGKQGGSAASAELIRDVLAVFAAAGVPVQPGLLGRVDEGGGGTVAQYLANRGIDTVDIGVAVLSMHSPMEISSKDDLWVTYQGFRAWLAVPTTRRGATTKPRQP